jgi:hypothetical protein
MIPLSQAPANRTAARRVSPSGARVGESLSLSYTADWRERRKDRFVSIPICGFRHTARVVLGVLLIAALAAALAGALAPVAAAAPDAAQIDGFLALHGSPMTGSGNAFVAAGQANGVDPAFLVAIAGAESSFGLYLYSEGGDQCTFNAFNWFYGSTWPQSDFGSWDEGIGRVAQGLAGELYYGAGLYSVDAIAPRYCPDGTDDWIRNVSSFMTVLGGDPADTRLPGGPSWPSSASSPSTEPVPVVLDGAVTVYGGHYRIGDVVDVAFTIGNRDSGPAALDGITLVVRGPAGAGGDMVSRQPLSLEPGESVAVSASWPLDEAGLWSGWLEVDQGGESRLVGEKQAFAFRVAPDSGRRVCRWILRK